MLENNDKNIIQYIAISNLIDRKILVDYCEKSCKVNNKKYRHDTKDLLDKMLLISITPEERKTDKLSQDQKIISIVDCDARWVFVSVISFSYPERIGYRMLSELQNKHLDDLNQNFLNILGKGDCVEENYQKSMKDNIQLSFVQFLQKYNELGSVDKISNVQFEVDNTKVVMKENVNKMIENLEDAENLGLKTDALKASAQEFKNETKELKKQTAWGNKKMTIAVGGVGGAVLLIIILKFIL
ncbi:MAG: synaptobrevin family protein [archaeon]|nr:synaptobrevin family protein [archaeon]